MDTEKLEVEFDKCKKRIAELESSGGSEEDIREEKKKKLEIAKLLNMLGCPSTSAKERKSGYFVK